MGAGLLIHIERNRLTETCRRDSVARLEVVGSFSRETATFLLANYPNPQFAFTNLSAELIYYMAGFTDWSLYDDLS